jgi:micrococcal nuclease
VVIFEDKPTRLRLIGIDAPESYTHHDKTQRTHIGESVSRIVQAWLTGKTIYLEYDAEQEDLYGRQLAYAWIDSHHMINEILVREGLVDVKHYEPNVRYDDYFAMLERLAKKEQRGIWATP